MITTEPSYLSRDRLATGSRSLYSEPDGSSAENQISITIVTFPAVAFSLILSAWWFLARSTDWDTDWKLCLRIGQLVVKLLGLIRSVQFK